uniref:Nalphaacetyltransferase 15, NatA auxiliary subunitlike [Apis florea] n=2 Tax=Lepeophtheirus salmonis TaxID=72036 RepID=A0A0K2T4J7_LEPSM
MSYHLLEDYDMALKILGEFRETYEKTTYDFEHSELLLYQNMVMNESGDVEGALNHLEKYEKQICDKMTLLEIKGKYLLHLGRNKEAEEVYRSLIKRNPENHSHYDKLIDALEVRQDEDKQLEMYQSYTEKMPRAQAPRRLALVVAKGSNFKKLLDAYLKKALRKGVPPLFVDLRALYSDQDKVKIIEETVTTYLENLLEYSSFEKKGSEEPVTAVLWVYYYLGQHYDFLGDHIKAVDAVDRAIEHTPTLIELLLLKGKINKHVGNIDEAVKYLNEAQSLDTADRYLNCKSAKYLLRANKVTEAEEMCQRFTREGVSAMENLNEMQCMWFQTECALSYWRSGQFGDALKKCIEVDRHFTDMVEDQFDFHTYCMRKMTLRSYIELLRFEDQLRSHTFFEKAAHCAIKIYLQLFDKPLPDHNTNNYIDTENLDPSELKKIRNKQKKALRKAEQEQHQQQQVQAKKNLHNKAQKKNDDELDIPMKEELFPQKLERPQSPLNEAIKFLTPLQSLCSEKMETQLLAFEIYFRKEKPLLMLKCIKKAKKILVDTSLKALPPKVYIMFSKFHRYIESNMSKFHSPVKTVIEQETQDIFGKQTATQRNEEFIASNAKSFEHLAAGIFIYFYVSTVIYIVIIRNRCAYNGVFRPQSKG